MKIVRISQYISSRSRNVVVVDYLLCLVPSSAVEEVDRKVHHLLAEKSDSSFKK